MVDPSLNFFLAVLRIRAQNGCPEFIFEHLFKNVVLQICKHMRVGTLKVLFITVAPMPGTVPGSYIIGAQEICMKISESRINSCTCSFLKKNELTLYDSVNIYILVCF